MSVFTFDAKASNPVTTEDVISLGQELGIKESDPKSVEEYKKLLAVFHDSCEEVMGMEDYIPKTDFERFPRGEVYFPSKEENKLGGWAYKCDIKDTQPNNGLLKGMNVVLKDCMLLVFQCFWGQSSLKIMSHKLMQLS